jgi:hypothetical protein
MADAGTLATSAQVVLAIGSGASATQILEANTNYWILYAESEMEALAGSSVGLVSHYASITASYKQWLAVVAANRAAMHAVNQNPNSWQLSVAQSKQLYSDDIWQDFKKNIKDKDVIASMGL